MHILRITSYAFMALVLAAGWAFLYWQGGAVDLAAVDSARLALNDLRAALLHGPRGSRQGAPSGSVFPRTRA